MKPTKEDLSRDLVADLTICESATPGPWKPSRHPYDYNGMKSVGPILVAKDFYEFGRDAYPDSVFAASAREGWPAAIRRAIAAEAEVARLQILAAYLAGELSSGQAGKLLGIEDVVDLREMAAAVIDAAGERWRVWREANPPGRL